MEIRILNKSEFDERDRLVRRCAYDSQNELGRLCDEFVYENDLARRLRAVGFAQVHTQFPVTLTHGSFQKLYRLDLMLTTRSTNLKPFRPSLANTMLKC